MLNQTWSLHTSPIACSAAAILSQCPNTLEIAARLLYSLPSKHIFVSRIYPFDPSHLQRSDNTREFLAHHTKTGQEALTRCISRNSAGHSSPHKFSFIVQTASCLGRCGGYAVLSPTADLCIVSPINVCGWPPFESFKKRMFCIRHY